MKKKIIPIVALSTMLLGQAMPVFCEGEINPSKGEIPVTLTVEANYKVSLPAQVDLEYTSDGAVTEAPAFAADYDVVTTGSLPSEKALEITCEDVTLTGDVELVATNGFNATAGDAGVKTVAVSADEIDGMTVKGHLETAAHGVSNGTYEGTANFSYKLVNAQ